MKSEYICIVCPNGCELSVEYEGETMISCSGNRCQRGYRYAESMITDPMRSVTSSVLVEGGVMPLVSVRTSAPVSKKRMFDVVRAIKELKVQAPVARGQVLVSDVLGLGADIIATRSVEAKKV